MHKKYDLAVFIGRFQPLHFGHVHAIRRGLAIANTVLVLIGDTGGPRTPKNPWTFRERAGMIERVFANECAAYRNEDLDGSGIVISYVLDYPYDDQAWLAGVHDVIDDVAKDTGAKRIALIGHEKDHSSYYLRMFPKFDFVDVGFEELDGKEVDRKIDATQVREFIFEDRMAYTMGVLPREVRSLIIDGWNAEMDAVQREYDSNKKYKKSWAAAPYPPVFVTTDAVVVQSGYVLLVKRGQEPGKGLWALPGGFLNQNETLRACAIRELIEETSIKLQPEVLDRCIAHVETFDHPGRDARGRIITHAHLFKLNDTKELPPVCGSDDAAEAAWVGFFDLRRSNMYSDHYHIITEMLNKHYNQGLTNP